MRPLLLLPAAAALAALSLAGCSKPAQNEAAEAAESVQGDSNTMGEALNDLAAADAAAFAGAENRYDAIPGNAAMRAEAEGAVDGPDANGSGDEDTE